MTKLALVAAAGCGGFLLALAWLAPALIPEAGSGPRDVYVELNTAVAIGDDYLSCSVGSVDVLVNYEPENAIEIAYTHETALGTPQIVLGRRFLDFTPGAQAFIFLHECGHAIRGHLANWEVSARTEETGLLADCFAAREIARLGHFHDETLADLQPPLWPERVDAIRTCARSATAEPR